ncbi:hypothetical protein J437_LFUL016420 [Ladona fulva]|uniref:Uncharacterized protein n=1 Tax=Ladona fulva TaxID=123851 RepID=A0A8K0KMY9_LADFU|nr:hypothetical protein J437_LFUL016420 [Ladona fulva]
MKQAVGIDVKIVLVGFGGHGQKWPSIFTTNGQIAFDGKGENVKFEKVNEDKQRKNKLFDELPGDMKEYVRRLERMRKLFNVEFGMVNYGDTFQLVRDYPFRAGAARTVVAVLQSRCLYSPLPVSVSLDKNSMYTVADGKKKNLVGDSELRKEMGYNKDLCVDFAFATRGAAFSSSNFMELSKPGLKKQFIQVVSQRISQSLAPELTEDCTCKLYHGLHPVTRCWVTSRKERENLKVATKGVKG